MTQSELWLAKWQEAIDFLETNHRKPSKFVPEERNMLSWWKPNKKLMNAGELAPDSVVKDSLTTAGDGYELSLYYAPHFLSFLRNKACCG